MKTNLRIIGRLVLLFIFMLSIRISLAQKNSLPSTKLKTLDGRTIDSRSISGNGQPLLMVFWKTSESRSCENLKSLHEVYRDSLLPKKIKMVAICVDEAGSTAQIKPYLAGQAIEIDVYIDINGDFRRAMGVTAPYTIVFDHKMDIFCQQRGYCTGNQELVCKEIEKCLNLLPKVIH
ncbi:MAG: TlpA disulfide reductase family protein [Bacteroidales bacterium]|nr:TlpA disulfide reductase family protein [Bacteroidales bacterium]